MKRKVSEAMPTLVALAALPGRQVNFKTEKKTKILKEFLQNSTERKFCANGSQRLVQRVNCFSDSPRQWKETLDSLSTKPRCSSYPYNTLNKASAVKYAYFPIHLSQQVQPQKAACSSIYNASGSVNSKARFQALHWQE